MLKVTSVSRVPVEGKRVARHFFRTRVWVTCNVEFPPELGRIAVIKRLRQALKANAEALGATPETEFYFSKGSGECNAGWGSGGGFMMNHAIAGEQSTLFVTIEEA
jgi:hypothetical protein